jgi:hypothetical protein
VKRCLGFLLCCVLGLSLSVVGCARKPQLDRDAASRLIAGSRALRTPMDLWADLGLKGTTRQQLPVRELIAVDRVSVEQHEGKAQADFRWKWSAPLNGTYRSTAHFRLTDTGWSIEDDDVLLAEMRRARRE